MERASKQERERERNSLIETGTGRMERRERSLAGMMHIPVFVCIQKCLYKVLDHSEMCVKINEESQDMPCELL